MPKKISINLTVPSLVATGLMVLAKLFAVAPFAEASWWVCVAPALLLISLPFLVVGVVLSAIACAILAMLFLTVLTDVINSVRR